MSRKSAIITVEPPPHNTDTEKHEITGFSCPYCCGQGSWSEQIGYNEYEEHTCNVCHGAKNIKAVIKINWIPDLNSE